MFNRIKNSLLFAVCCSIGGALGCILMKINREWPALILFFVTEFVVSFVVHILLTLPLEKLKDKKQ